MAEALTKEFNKSLTNILEYISSQARDQVLSRLITLNFGEVPKEKLPYLKFSEINPSPLVQLIQSAGLATLIGTGALVADETLQNATRFALGLPELESIGETEVIEDTMAQPKAEPTQE